MYLFILQKNIYRRSDYTQISFLYAAQFTYDRKTKIDFPDLYDGHLATLNIMHSYDLVP